MTVGFDAVPLSSGHASRGIGRYVTGILGALLDERPDWCREHLRCLVVGDQRLVGVRSWRTHRSSFRRQDLDWLASAMADRWAIRSARPSAWHMTDPWTPLSPLPAARTIATVYDLIPLLEPAVMARIRPHRRLIYGRYLKAIQRARLVIAISETTAEDVTTHLGIPRDRIRVIYPSIRTPARVIETAGSVDGPLHLLFVGVPEYHKRPELALRVLRELKERRTPASLTFVGQQPAGRRQSLERLASDLGVLDRVRFSGQIDDDELAELYRTTITLAISRTEGFGLPPVEALLAGGSVVATPSRISREVLASAATVSVSDEPGAIADAVLLASASGPRRDPSSVVELASRYAPRNAAEALVAAYEAVLDS